MKWDQVIQIVMLGGLIVIVVFVAPISVQNDLYSYEEPKKAVDVPCIECRADTHRKTGLTKLMNCIVKLNGIKLLKDKETKIYSTVTRDEKQQDIWAIEQVSYDTQCHKETKIWEVDANTILIINERVSTTVC